MSDQRDYGDELAEATTASAVAALRQHLPGVTQGEMGLTLPCEEQVPGDAVERLMAEVARLRVGLRHALWQVGQLTSERDRLRQQQREQLIQATAEIERLRAECADVESLWRDAAEAGAALSAAEEAIEELRADRETANTRISEQDAEIERLRAECDRRAIMVAWTWTAAPPLDWAAASEALGIRWQYPVDESSRRRAEMIYAVAAEGAALIRRAEGAGNDP